MISLILLIVFVACVAMLGREGLWSNTLTLINVLTSALLAMSLWEPLADYMDREAPTYTYFFDFLALWAVFCVSMIVCRIVTDKISRVRVRFKAPVDRFGGAFVAAWVGWVMVCFVTMTLHTAPLARNFLGGGFQPTPETRMFFGLGPDRKWLGFTQKVSRGTLSSPPPAGTVGEEGLNVFDPQGEFILRYGQRRFQMQKESHLRVRR